MLPPLPPSRFCLFLDVDGTLIDIAPRPDAVVVPPGLKDDLAALDAKLHGAIGLVSGRSIVDIDRLFAPLRLRASGVHGAEMRHDRDGPIEAAFATPLPDVLIGALNHLAESHPGTLVENKRFSAAFHYRAVPERGAGIGRALAHLIKASGLSDLTILPGHMVFEVKRTGFDKGMAIGRFMARAPFAGRMPVFLGDDVTDEPGFDVVAASGGLAYPVGVTRHGFPSRFASPAQVREWLGFLAREDWPDGRSSNRDGLGEHEA